MQIAPGLVVRGDATLLEVVVTNLLENAVKFTAGRDPVRIEVSTQDQPNEFPVGDRV